MNDTQKRIAEHMVNRDLSDKYQFYHEVENLTKNELSDLENNGAFIRDENEVQLIAQTDAECIVGYVVYDLDEADYLIGESDIPEADMLDAAFDQDQNEWPDFYANSHGWYMKT